MAATGNKTTIQMFLNELKIYYVLSFALLYILNQIQIEKTFKIMCSFMNIGTITTHGTIQNFPSIQF